MEEKKCVICGFVISDDYEECPLDAVDHKPTRAFELELYDEDVELMKLLGDTQWVVARLQHSLKAMECLLDKNDPQDVRLVKGSLTISLSTDGIPSSVWRSYLNIGFEVSGTDVCTHE